MKIPKGRKSVLFELLTEVFMIPYFNNPPPQYVSS